VTSLGRRVLGALFAACGLLITDPAHAYRTAAALPEIDDDAVVHWGDRGPMLQPLYRADAARSQSLATTPSSRRAPQ
jgi:hypothetical protein